MPRRTHSLILCATLAAGCSSRLVSEDPVVRKGGQVAVGGWDAGLGTECLKEFPIVPKPGKVEVLVLFDRSDSMALLQGGQSRFAVASQPIAETVLAWADTVDFGFESFPAQDGCGANAAPGCCALPPSVSVEKGGAEAVAEALQKATPLSGSAPTAMALEYARQHFAARVSVDTARFVFLVTDGDPTCTLQGQLTTGRVAAAGDAYPACQDAVDSVEMLVAAGVRVPVVGVGLGAESGSISEGACLDRLAHAGAAAASPGSPGYFEPSTFRQAWKMVVQAIAGDEVPTCRWVLPWGEGVNVRMGKTLLTKGSPDGYEIVRTGAGTQLYLMGAACERAKQLQVDKVVVEYPRGVCLD